MHNNAPLFEVGNLGFRIGIGITMNFLSLQIALVFSRFWAWSHFYVDYIKICKNNHVMIFDAMLNALELVELTL